MIFGECPYCDEPIVIASPDTTPAMGKETCEHCGEQFWEYYSRINPQALTRDQVIVDEENKSVKLAEGVNL